MKQLAHYVPDPYRKGLTYEGFWGRTPDGLLVGKSPQHPAADPLARLYRETAAMTDSTLRMVQAFPDAPSAQLKLCEGLEAIINVAAHRLSTGEIEEVLAAHPDVAECAVIGVADALKGQVPLGLLVLKAGVIRPADEVEREAVQLVRDRIGPVASFRTALVVAGLPKTRSGKILRGTMRKIADGEDYPLPGTIDDPAILGEIGDVLKKAGYATVAGSRRHPG